MDLSETEMSIRAVLAAAEGWLPSEQLAEMRELVAAGEPGIALENFCTQLEEFDVDVPADLIRQLRNLADAMGIVLSPWITGRK